MTAQTGGFPELLELLGFGPDDAVTLCHQPPGGRFEARWTTADKAPAVADDYPGEHAWFSVNGLRHGKDAGRGGTADVTRLSALYADLDVKPGGLPTMKAATDVVNVVSELMGTKTAAIIMSGHGLQPMWVLDPEDSDAQLDDDNRARAVAILRRFGRLVSHVAATRGGRVDAVFDLARVLRVPGTMNVKDPDAPVPVGVMVCEDSRPLTVAEIDEILDLYGAVERTGDRDQAGGEIIAPVACWTWSASTHPAVARAVTSWSGATPASRHPWTVGVATSLAFARRLGMVSEADHLAAVHAVTERFRWLLGHQSPVRAESVGEAADCFTHGVNVAQRKTEADAVADWTFWTELVAGPRVTVLDDQEAVAFWSSRPVLTHIHQFARARRCSPLAVLGICIVRVLATAPPHVVLPPLVGSYGSLNAFVAVIGASGSGKGSAERYARDAIGMGKLRTAPTGSGEGVAALFTKREKGKNVPNEDRSAIMSVAEVSTLEALKGRNGATILGELCKAWSGEQLGFQNGDPERTRIVPEHSYRLCAVVGVQPAKAGGLLDEEGQGLPQRFQWVPGGDPDAPDTKPAEPAPLTLGTDTRRWVAPFGWFVFAMPPIVEQTVDANRLARLRGEGEPLDGHSLQTRMKVTAGFAMLDGRTFATEDDWRLAGVMMTVSDRVRAGSVYQLRRAAELTLQARGVADGKRAVATATVVSDDATRRVSRGVVRHLRKAGGKMHRADLRRKFSGADRNHFEDAVALLIDAGQVDEQGDGRATEYALQASR